MAHRRNRDWRLAQRMLRGEEAAFEEFFEGHFPKVYRFALARMGNDPDGAEEVAQATLCTAISKLATYRGEAALLTWVCAICRQEISAHFRRKKRQPPALDLVEDTAEVKAAFESLWAMDDRGPEEALRRKEVARLVQVTLDGLPGRYGDALEWKYAHGLSVKEIASRLGMSPKAAESMLTRARQAFRDGFSALAQGRGARPSALNESW